jgi:hypothetical protein
MSTGRVTTATDTISPKNPAGLRIAFTKTGGNEASLALTDITDDDYVTKLMLEGALQSTSVELRKTTPIMPLTLTSTDLGQPISNFGNFPKIRVVLDAGNGVLNSELTGFTTGVIPTAGVPTSIIVDDGSGVALAYNIIVIISTE